MTPALRGLRPAAELAAARPHGDRLRYIAGCKCVECRRANTEYEKQRAWSRKAGEWNGIVPADQARAHLLALAAAGVGRRQVADASGVAESILHGVRMGRRPQLRKSTERAILAVTAAAAADRAYIDAGPTWELLNALLATGYTKAHLARELGYQVPALQLRRDRVTARNAYDVQQLHQRLRRVPAAASIRRLQDLREEGFRPDRIEAMARDLAARQGQPVPDLQVHGGAFISAAAAQLIERLHGELTEVPA